MPAIAPTYRNCTVYLYPDRLAAESGKRVGGTGFIVGIFSQTRSQRFYPHVVTNAHVVDGGNYTIRFNTKDGKSLALETDPAEWVVSTEDDLAVYPTDMPENAEFMAIMPDVFIDDSCTIDGWPLFPGDDVVMYGRFIDHDGRQRNKPVVRFGSISMLPDQDATVRVNNRDQLAFLVECRSMGGFSGSPVFVHLAQPRLMDDATFDKKGWIPLHWRFLGVDCGHLPFFAGVRDKPSVASQRVDGLWSETNSGIAVVIPAWRLERLLNDERLANERERVDRSLILLGNE